MTTKVPLVTAMQEKLDNSMLTVRKDHVILGRVYCDAPGKWVILPPERPKLPRMEFPSLLSAVEALCDPNTVWPT